ncbi:hypothetical protein GWI33_016849 [Rhynchophorus ferrugineus]|uniref:Uncharacterized protein n=1 Tax=Rhynchophorus ferrugineus TaxID=354439 RepID=A0A834HXV1_RHYFE|nr:hypothetical protein GWI33_016849 [Rhynchophorus ferrugineus]
MAQRRAEGDGGGRDINDPAGRGVEIRSFRRFFMSAFVRSPPLRLEIALYERGHCFLEKNWAVLSGSELAEGPQHGSGDDNKDETR